MSAKSHREVQSACAGTTHRVGGGDVAGTGARERCSKLQSATRLKGRLGHLVTAIAEAHGGQVPQPTRPLGWVDGKERLDDVETYTCRQCDRMFSCLSEFEQHVLVCSRT